MKLKSVCALGLSFVLALVSLQASAALITYETRQTTSGVNQSDYQASWFNQGSSIVSQNLSAFTNVTAPSYNHHSHLQVNFEVGSAFASSDWAFQVAPDAGFGGSLFLNGVQLDIDSSDLWWGWNWNNINELLTATGVDVAEDSHQLDVYWAEGCCNGGQSARFSYDNGQSWLALSVDNLNAVAVDVPEPSGIALLGMGLLGLAYMRKRQDKQSA